MSDAHDVDGARLKLANQILSICLAATSVTRVWKPYFYEQHFDLAPDLRDKLFVVMISGMLDTANSHQDRIAQLKKECDKTPIPTGKYYLDRFQDHIALLVDLLSIIPEAQFARLALMRNQWVHGYWESSTKNIRKFRCVVDGKVIQRKVPTAEFNDMQVIRAPDETLIACRERFFSEPTFFWISDAFMAKPEVQEIIYNDLRRSKSGLPEAVFNFPAPGFKPTLLDRHSYPWFKSFNECVEFGVNSERTPDPAAPRR